VNFASLEFALYFLVVYILYRVLPFRGQNAMLLVASYFFYGCWDWRFTFLMAFASLANYAAALGISHARSQQGRKAWLLFGIVASLSVLGFFKYFNFFVDSIDSVLHWLQLDYLSLTGLPRILLPMGISFFTFQAMSYTIDVYRGDVPVERDPLEFLLFISFFPQLVAGPIERASHLLGELKNPRVISAEQSARGLYLILLGLLKKVAIADGISPSVDAIYASPTGSAIDVVLATYLFAVQIYCDFSAYSDIARGCAKLLGIELMLNFRYPYFATNPRDFWSRWHISLSTWLRDYLYIPLGGNRGSSLATYRNLMITMTLGGLWHGAAWNFVLWGVFQGVLLCVHRAIWGSKPDRLPHSAFEWLKRILLAGVFFQIVCYGWLLFRARSFGQIASYSQALITGWNRPSALATPPLSSLLGLALLSLIEIASFATDDEAIDRRMPIPLRGLFYALLIVLILMGTSNGRVAFIYFQF
jgi:D-alanyl-lipoteichoic acid acyltransferase DltB (MBOAT superfamily)